MMLSYTVIIALIASSVLSVDAIRCHQCNSHLDEDCISLRLNTPRAPRDNQYLRECEGSNSALAFCRKTVLSIDVSGEYRIVRGCGWIQNENKRNNTCFDNDSEGYVQTICSCFDDGCNAAPPRLGDSHAVPIVALACASMLLTSVLRRRG